MLDKIVTRIWSYRDREKETMMVDWMLISIVELIIILVGTVIWISSSVSAAKKRKVERLNKEGIRVHAKVTNVKIDAARRKYTVKARWYSNKTEHTYYFVKTFLFPKGSTSKFRPKINEGDMIYVVAAFKPLIYRMEKHW